MIRVTIEIEHGDGSIKIERNDAHMAGWKPERALKVLVEEARLSAQGALNARTV